jgi:hypothetical protein
MLNFGSAMRFNTANSTLQIQQRDLQPRTFTIAVSDGDTD